MSRKQILTKKVAHTILAMSIVSAGGLNLWAGTAWAAANGNNGADDIRENVSISDSVDISVAGGNGTDGTVPAAVLMMPAALAVTAALQALVAP